MPDNDNQHEYVVTPQMIAAGDAAWQGGNLKDSLAAMYRAMRAASPDPIVSPNSSDVPEGERIAINRAYIAEGRVKELEAELSGARHDNLTWAQRSIDGMAERHALRTQLVGANGRIAELETLPAQRPAAFVDPEPEPLKHNPYREFNTDRRRIGNVQ